MVLVGGRRSYLDCAARPPAAVTANSENYSRLLAWICAGIHVYLALANMTRRRSRRQEANDAQDGTLTKKKCFDLIILGVMHRKMEPSGRKMLFVS